MDCSAARRQYRGEPGRKADSGTSLRACYALSGTDIAYQGLDWSKDGRILRVVAYPYPLSSYTVPMRCPVLTNVLHTRCPVLTYRLSLSSPLFGMRCPVLTWVMSLPGIRGGFLGAYPGTLSPYVYPTRCPVLTQLVRFRPTRALCDARY
eukprot:2461482-Rhodomonas_salina.2